MVVSKPDFLQHDPVTNAFPLDHHIRFVPTFDDLLAAHRLSLPPAGRLYRYSAAWMILGLILNAESELFYQGSTVDIIVIGVGIGMLVFGFWCLISLLLARSVLFRRKVRGVFAQQASYRDDHDIAWSDTGLTVRSTFSSTYLPWDRFIRYREGTAIFLLYQSDLLFNFMPKRCMTAEQIKAFRNHVVPRVAKG